MDFPSGLPVGPAFVFVTDDSLRGEKVQGSAFPLKTSPRSLNSQEVSRLLSELQIKLCVCVCVRKCDVYC